MDARVREAVVSLSVVDGESLLTPAIAQRLVAAVMQALAAQRDDEERRRSDTSIGEACGCGPRGEA